MDFVEINRANKPANNHNHNDDNDEQEQHCQYTCFQRIYTGEQRAVDDDNANDNNRDVLEYFPTEKNVCKHQTVTIKPNTV